MATPSVDKSQPQALITPSASPPHHRPFFPPPFRISDASPPLKRQRVSRARSASVQRPGSKSTQSATPDTELDIEKAREASARRLLDVWNGLAERYSKPMDEDDIVDLSTGKIVKNRGVLKNTKKSFKIGCFTETNAEETDNGTEPESEYPSEEVDCDEGLGEEEEEEGGDMDEIDVLAKADAKKKRIQAIAANSRVVPPVRKKDATDAEDLRDFLKAEKQRKLLSGDYEDESDDDPEPEPEYVSEADEDADADEEEDLLPTTDAEEPPASQADTGYSRSSSPVIEIDSSSDDELNAWRHEKVNAVYRRPATLAPEESDSEVEIIGPPRPISVRPIDPPRPPSPSSSTLFKPANIAAPKATPRKPFPVPKLTKKPLPTPPLSHSSSSIPPPSTPLDDDSELPFFAGTSSPLPPSSPPSSSLYGSSPTRPLSKTRSLPQITPKPPTALKTKSIKANNDRTPIPRVDKTRMQQPRPKSTLKRQINVPKSPSPPAKIIPLKLQKLPSLAPTPPLDPPKTKTKVEVVIEPRKVPPKPSTQKRVEKRVPEARHNSDEESVPESPPLPRPPVKTFKQPGLPASKSHRKSAAPSETPSKQPSSPPHKTTANLTIEKPRSSPSPADKLHRKRKRIVSAEFIIDDEPPIESSGSARRINRAVSPKPGSSKVPEPSVLSDPFAYHSSPGHMAYKRSQSYFEPYPPFPPSDPGYFPQTQQTQPQSYSRPQHTPFQPLPDPRAQIILAQAMHQLHALYTNPWTPHRAATPMTYPSPQYYPHTPGIYNTPTQPTHNPHSYGYPYDTSASKATLPPETPHSPPSPVRERRKALVERSRSRGRRVSFRMEEDDDPSDNSEPARKPSSKGKGKARASSADAVMGSPSPEPEKKSSSARKGKQKATARAATVSDSEPELPSSPPPQRGRSYRRGQTPGPPLTAQDSNGRPPGRARSKSVSVRIKDS